MGLRPKRSASWRVVIPRASRTARTHPPGGGIAREDQAGRLGVEHPTRLRSLGLPHYHLIPYGFDRMIRGHFYGHNLTIVAIAYGCSRSTHSSTVRLGLASVPSDRPRTIGAERRRAPSLAFGGRGTA